MPKVLCKYYAKWAVGAWERAWACSMWVAANCFVHKQAQTMPDISNTINNWSQRGVNKSNTLQKVNSGDCCQALLATPQSPASRSDLDINQLGHAHAECKSYPAKSQQLWLFNLKRGEKS